MPGSQDLIQLLDEGQVVQVREDVHHPVIFQEVLEREKESE